jgi:uncharacterized protein YoaH (UPF0181 family)
MTGRTTRILPKNSPPAFFKAAAVLFCPVQYRSFCLQVAPGGRKLNQVSNFGSRSLPALHASENNCRLRMHKDSSDPNALAEARALALLYPTPWAKKEIRRRQNILADFRELVAAGMSRGAAARKAGSTYPTVWRWLRRSTPDTFRCGRKSPFNEANVSAEIVERIQELQLTGLSNPAAWWSIASEEICPPSLADFLRAAKRIPPSFLKATRLLRYWVRIRVVKGRKFTVMERYEPEF